jgi:hypothetical protein
LTDGGNAAGDDLEVGMIQEADFGWRPLDSRSAEKLANGQIEPSIADFEADLAKLALAQTAHLQRQAGGWI